MIKNDKWIIERAAEGMIQPFVPELVRKVHPNYAEDYPWPRNADHKRPVISYGLSSYGYDIRLSPNDFRIFRHIPGTVVDPKNFSLENLESAKLHSDRSGDYFVLPAHTYGLGVALERLLIPSNITCLFIGKSTYARCGLIWNLTPGEAGWTGHLTLEVSNSSSADCRIYANEGVIQALFLEGEECGVTYEDRQGKYQDQPECVVTAKV